MLWSYKIKEILDILLCISFGLNQNDVKVQTFRHWNAIKTEILGRCSDSLMSFLLLFSIDIHFSALLWSPRFIFLADLANSIIAPTGEAGLKIVRPHLINQIWINIWGEVNPAFLQFLWLCTGCENSKLTQNKPLQLARIGRENSESG